LLYGRRLMTSPPAGAGLEIVTVPVVALPPTTEVGLTVTPTIVGAVTVSAADRVAVPSAAVIVAERFAATAVVLTVNAPIVWPAAIVKLVATVTPPEVLSLAKAIARPPVGAALEIVTVPVELVPPTTEVGLSTRAVSLGAQTVSVADWDTPFSVPDIVAVIVVGTAVVETVNVPLVWPAATVTLAGTVTPLAVLLLERAITSPLAGAALEMVIVPADVLPPTNDVGFSVKPVRVGAVTVSAAGCVAVPNVAVIFAVRFVATAVVLTVKVPVV